MSRSSRIKFNNHRFVRRRVFSKIRFSSATFNVLVIGIIVLVSLFYLIQSNKISTYGFKIKELEEELRKLRQENEKFELEVTKLQSISKIEEVGRELSMIKVEKVDYITQINTSMAIK